MLLILSQSQFSKECFEYEFALLELRVSHALNAAVGLGTCVVYLTTVAYGRNDHTYSIDFVQLFSSLNQS